MTHIQRRFWNLEGAVALETGILVAVLHHLAAARELGAAVETLRLLLGQGGTMGGGVQAT